MAAETGDGALDRALAHPVRADLVRLLWHAGEAASAVELAQDVPQVALGTVAYHLRILERAGVVEAQENRDGGAARQSFVVAGPSASEAVGHLKLS